MAVAAVGGKRREFVVQARSLSVQYGPVQALDDVDIDVRRGEIIALAGENGAGKSTLVRCLAGDMTPDTGQVLFDGRSIGNGGRSTTKASKLGVAVVWQNLALCDNLDIAANLLLGRETRRLMFSETRFHTQARDLLDRLGIALPGTTSIVANLSGGQRQLVAVARAMRDHPELLILDEPTASLGVFESARVEELAASLPGQGTTVMIVSHDIEQMFRLADRIVILRRGRVIAEVDPASSHPDEVAALLSGQPLDVSARRQLSRLHNLADQLASAEPSSSLDLIMSALRAALGAEQVCIHVLEGSQLQMAGSIGLPRRLRSAWSTLPSGLAGGQVGLAVASGEAVLTADVHVAPSWARHRVEANLAGVQSSWSVPFTGASGDQGVITVMSRAPGEPSRDDIDLAALYAGYAASALERDRLLGEVTTRNRVLETIREVLETLAGPVPLEVGLGVALRALQAGLGAEEVALVTRDPGQARATYRGWAGPARDGEEPPADLLALAAPALDGVVPAGPAAPGHLQGNDGEVDAETAAGWIAVGFPAPDGAAALVARWPNAGPVPVRSALIDDAANSLRLALEREASERAQRETMALRSSQELQRKFLSWLSHELRTPLTAIRGYASSLMQPDVDWDGSSQQRFLERISAESARLGRLVDDLLDFSAIDAGILRIHPDWCDLPLVLEAARACVPSSVVAQVAIESDPHLPVVWADHDRLEQIFVNLIDNALRHNPAGTHVTVKAGAEEEGFVNIAVTDDGIGMDPTLAEGGLVGRADRRSRTGGAGLGLSIARGIVSAHGGELTVERLSPGTRCAVRLPVALEAPLIETGASDGPPGPATRNAAVSREKAPAN